MNIEIINEEYNLNLYGFSGTAINKDYVGTAFKLSGKLWEIVKSKQLKNKGINIWVYEPGDKVFTGVELYETPESDIELEQKTITLAKHARYKHIGPYSQIKQAGIKMENELKNRGFEIILPYIEIYGHWTSDETKAETDLLMCLK